MVAEFNNIPKKERKANPFLKPDTLDSKLDEFVTLRNKFAHRTYFQGKEEIANFDGETISIDTKEIKNAEIKLTSLKLDNIEIEKIQIMLNDVVLAITELENLVRKENDVVL